MKKNSNMREHVDIWKVFVPYDILMSPKGQLCGRLNEQLKLVYISGILNASISTNTDTIGLWDPSETSRSDHDNRRECFVYIKKSLTGQLECDVIMSKCSVVCSCIIYNPEDLVKSYFITCRDIITERETSKTGILQTVVNYIQEFPQNRKSDYKDSWSLPTLLLLRGLIWMFGLFRLVTFTLDNRITSHYGVVRQVLDTPALAHQLSNRCKQNALVIQKTSTPLQHLRCMDALSRQVVDTGLGVAMMYFLMQSNISDTVAASVSSWADQTADNLSLLLEWLMGVPAGLKLNSQLTQYLGHFFLYHIYLWKGYLYLLKPVLSGVLWYSLCVGVIGVTAQLCILQDIVSMMTLHVYCFYVYAARLYRLQVYTLSALWRLFRGKKWNTLRQRVDSSSFDVDQLFVGTLLFTILLFMLPTTVLYYTVFTLLRLLTLMVHGLLTNVVHFLNHFPVHTTCLWLIHPKSVTDNIVFNPLPSDKRNGDCIFSMQVTPPSFFKLLDLSHQLCSRKRDVTESWGSFVSSLLKGHLVCPWIDLNGINRDKVN
ncbi:phosphatidylinositol N-acetylglucosaminyltransferase subunit Q-like isoform X1 [Mizuhopecten yessoensis]|uniref:phosphatidylinositol N-acetylglucosaminyltransferase subunit Q-like isoform X1 n=1 Tax=Mizuhopecten yessoensis TaxID=6573 RepID=UPI000B457552|nr:phosphatidylinositol N-acetylglucosaminyltransferase subunit Q-like isoform X1 [Mizuhopecten yessoensis]